MLLKNAEGRSPVGRVILVSRAPVHRSGPLSSRADSTPVRMEDIVRLTDEVLEEEGEVNINRKGPNGKVLHSGKGPASARKQSGGVGSSGLSASAVNPVSKVGISSTNVGGRSRDTNRRGGKKLKSRKSVPQCSRLANVDKKLPDLRMSPGESEVPGARKSRLRDSSRIDYSRSTASLNGQLRSEWGSNYTANIVEECDKDGNPVFSF